ncbi:hypothetical protein [Streptomyces sp. NBC_01217]|uniref:hypothetical protein n=1 Tax=Streptomyces sp. NBC_01217 TaxID=2903779 RepID=UPI002E14C693|nr:hypothetical protein OG507_00950 [Streptomyces sp. NBC_01217]
MLLDVTAEQIAEWDAELSVLTGSLGHLFNRPEPRVVFAQFIEGLLAELPAKNGWTLAERAGHVTADRMQWLLNGSVWDADRLRDAVRDYQEELQPLYRRVLVALYVRAHARKLLICW